MVVEKKYNSKKSVVDSVDNKVKNKSDAVVSNAVLEKNSVKPAKKVVKPTKEGRVYATGKRKNAIAKVWIAEGNGSIIINDKPIEEYLKRSILVTIVNQPFQRTNTEGKFDVKCSVLGGGLSGQAGAIKHAISIALQILNLDLRDVLKKAGFLTRDSRVVERKKAGLKKARKGQVYQRR
ncbi:MAG: 30S ribosomal protein S9 [Rickettsiales bacterium]|jgi:small subunit ribosomal protein S9|nr:30S ribosomal protein S9 [Rickettsiales bacterium]